MASLLCVKQPGGKLQIHNNDAIEELMIDSQDHISTTMMNRSAMQRRRSKRPYSTPAGSKPGSGMDSKSLIGQTLKVQDWLNEKTVKNLQLFAIPQAWVEKQEKSDVESKAARKLYNPLLETESTFVRDMEDYVSHKDVMDLRKKEMLHKKWNDRVHEPLRKKIIEVMDGSDWPELDRRKRELHKQYLEFVNEKGHVFLDTMDPREYYAQALNGHRPAPIKAFLTAEEVAFASDDDNEQVQTQKFRDPLLSQGRERSEEERTILRCMTGYNYTDKDIDQVKLPPLPLVPLGRQGTDSIKWLQMPLHNIESTPRMASRRRMQGVFNRCNVDFEEWSQAQYNHGLVDEELHIQKKRMFKEIPPFNRPPKVIRSTKKVTYDTNSQVCPEDLYVKNMEAIPEESQGLAVSMAPPPTQNGDGQTMVVS